MICTKSVNLPSVFTDLLYHTLSFRSAGHSTAQAAVCAECHCMTDHWHAMQWSYLVGITRTPLATHLRVRQVQSGMPGSPVAVRAGSSLLGRRLRSLRWADVSTCVVPQTLSSYGDRTFAAAGPHLCNSLPIQLRNPDITFGLFRRQLRGHLFREALCYIWYAAP